MAASNVGRPTNTASHRYFATQPCRRDLRTTSRNVSWSMVLMFMGQSRTWLRRTAYDWIARLRCIDHESMAHCEHNWRGRYSLHPAHGSACCMTATLSTEILPFRGTSFAILRLGCRKDFSVLALERGEVNTRTDECFGR